MGPRVSPTNAGISPVRVPFSHCDQTCRPKPPVLAAGLGTHLRASEAYREDSSCSLARKQELVPGESFILWAGRSVTGGLPDNGDS